MSSIWFSVHSRPVATSFLNATGSVINILSMYLPTLAINTDSITPYEEPQYKQRLADLYLYYAIIASLLGGLCVLLYRETPARPVSRVSTLQRLSLSASLTYLRTHISLLFPILAGALTAAVTVSYEVIVEAAFRKYGSSTLSIRDYTLLSAPFILGLSLAVSYCAGRWGFFRGLLIAGNIINLICLLVLLWIYEEAGTILFGSTFILTTAVLASQSSVGIEYLSELCFPVPEPFILSVLLFAVKISCLAILQVSSSLVQGDQTSTLLVVFIVLLLLSTLFFVLSKGDLNRRNLDKSSILCD